MAFLTDSLRSAIARINPFARHQAAPGVPVAFSHKLAISAYLSSGMLRKVIGIPADDRVREWRDWQADKDTIALVEAEEKRLGLQAKVKQLEVLRGIGGGALIVVTAGAHDEPLKPDVVGKGGIVTVNVVSRWQISGRDWVKDVASPNYGCPTMFEVSGATGTPVRIHPSRVICFRGEPLPAGTAVSDEEAFWGDSRLLRVITEVQRSDETQAWFAALVKKAKLLRIGIPNLTDFTATDDGKRKLDSRIALIAEGESALNAVVFDAGNGRDTDSGGERITDYQITWAGIPAVMDAFDQRVAAVADIPFTRLMGRSPAGMNATGAHDTDNWNKMVASGQNLELRPCLEQLDQALLRSAGVSKPSDVTWRFAPLWTPTEKEEADTFKTSVDAIKGLIDTGTVPQEAMAKGVQNWLSEREYLPGLDAALAEIPEAERFGIDPAAGDEDDDPSALQAEERGGGPNADRPFVDAKKRRKGGSGHGARRSFDPSKHPHGPDGRFTATAGGRGRSAADLSALRPPPHAVTYASDIRRGRGADPHPLRLGVPNGEASRRLRAIGIQTERPGGSAKPVVLDEAGTNHAWKHSSAADAARGRAITAEDIASAHHFVNSGVIERGVPDASPRGERRFTARAVRDGYELLAVFNERKYVLALHDIYVLRKAAR